MDNIKELANNTKAKALWGGVKTLIRETRGNITGENEQGVDIESGGASINSMDDGSGSDSFAFWSADGGAPLNEPEEPETDPKKVVLTRSQRLQQHPSIERMRDEAYRRDLSPDVPPKDANPRGGRGRKGPGPDLDPVYNRALNRHMLHRQQGVRDWRNERRDRYNGRGSPTRAESGGSDVLDKFIGDDLVEVQRDEYATDIKTRPPPKFDLGPAAVRKSETPKNEEDPFIADAKW